jgi:hypothetical protein
VGDGSTSVVTGVVFALVGTNVVAAFLVFSWLAWLGTAFFYRAFTVTFPGGDHRRYAYMLFFLPSLIFWTSDVGKEAIMVLSVGVAALGAARVLAFRRKGYPLVAVGTAIGAWVRPNELLLLFAGFALAMIVRPKDPRRLLPGARRIVGLAALIGVLILSAGLTFKYLHGTGQAFSLQQISKNNSNCGTGCASSNLLPYSGSIAAYPRDVYYVIFDPLPFNAHGSGQRLESTENLIIVVLILTSLRQLRMSFRVALNRPYVLVAGVYSVAFCYTFAALGNLGLINRERTILFPLFLVLLCIPISPKGAQPYPWERRRIKQADRRAMQFRHPVVPGVLSRPPY